MIRFLRYLIITIVLLAVAAYLAVYFMADRIIRRVEGRLTATFIAPFAPAGDDQYGYDASLHFWPPAVELTDLDIKAKALMVDGDVFENCELHVDRIVCDLIPLLRYGTIKTRSIEGRSFSGLLTSTRLAQRLEHTGGPLSNLVIDLYGRKCRIRGRFGSVSITDMTVTGAWAVDDRGVITLTDREYYNPDSYVPEGAIKIIEGQISFDVRIHILDAELTGEQASFNSSGLYVKVHD
jgi:hypothetical protein